MVSSNWLITNCESNRLIFKTFDKLNSAGDVEKSWGFYKTANKGQFETDRHDLKQSLKKDTEIIKKYRNERAKLMADPMLKGSHVAIHKAAMESLGDIDDELRRHIDTYGQNSDAATKWSEKQTEAFNNAKKGMKGLSASAKALLANIGAELAIALAFQAIMKVWQKMDQELGLTAETRLEKMEEAVNSYNDALSESSENIKSIESVSKEFEILANGVNDAGENISLTAEEYARYNEIVAELVAINPELVKGYTAEGNAIVDRNNAIKDGIKAQQDYADAATEAYLASGKDIVKSNKDTLKEAGKELTKNIAGKIIGARTGSKSYMRDSVIEDVLGRAVNTSNMSVRDYRDIAKHKEEILAATIEANSWERRNLKDIEKINALSTELASINTDLTNYDSAYSETLSWLTTYVTKADKLGQIATTSANTIIGSVPEALQNGYLDALDAIASNTEFSAEEMTVQAVNLANTLSNIYSGIAVQGVTNTVEIEIDGTDKVVSYQEAVNSAEEAKKEFDKSARDNDALSKYNDAISDEVEVLNILADEWESVDAVVAESLRSQASSISNYAKENILTIANAFNTAAEEIESARTVKERFDAAMEGGDYSTAINAFEEIYDTIMDGENNTGNGSLAFWEGAEMMLGSARLSELEYDFNKVNAAIKALNPTMDNTASAAGNFGEMLWNASEAGKNGARVIRDEFGEVVAEVSKNTAGGISFEIDNENLAVVAEQLGVSRDYLVAMIDSARQFSNVTWDNIDDIGKAIGEMDTTFKADGKQWQFYETIEAEASRAGIAAKEFDEIATKVVSNTNTRFIRLDDDAQTLVSSFASMSDIIATFDDASGTWTLDAEAFVTQMKIMGRSAEDAMKLLKRMQRDSDIDIKGIESFSEIEDFVSDKYLELQDLELGFRMESDERLIDSNDRLIDALDRNTLALGGTPELTLKEDISNTNKNLSDFSKAYPGLSDEQRKTYSSNIDSQINDLRVLKAEYQGIVNDAEAGILNLDDKQLQAYNDALHDTKGQIKLLADAKKDLDEDGKLDLFSFDDEGNLVRNTEKAGESIKGLSKDLDVAIEKSKEFKKENGKDGQYGNVNIYDRPIKLNKDGSYSTVKTKTYTYKEFGIDKEGYFNVTPILPNGEELTDTGLEKYIKDNLGKGSELTDLTKLDIFAGEYDTEESAVNAAEEMHEKSAEYYNQMADTIIEIKGLWDLLTKEQRKELGLENLDFSNINGMEDLEALLKQLQSIKLKVPVDEEFKNAIKSIEGLTDKEYKLVIDAVSKYENGGTLTDLVNDIESLPEEKRSKVVTEIVDSGGLNDVLKDLNRKERKLVVKALTEGDGNWEELYGILNKLEKEDKYSVTTLLNYKLGKVETPDNGELPTNQTINMDVNTGDTFPTLEEVKDTSKEIANGDYTADLNLQDNATPKLNAFQRAISLFTGKTYTAKVNIVESGTKGHHSPSKFDSDASGTLGRRLQSYFPSMASGGIRSRLGPNGKGGPTLTGELGAELVWEPSKGVSYLVGQYGPEMVNLPGDAVVYPADETRRIMGDIIPRNKMRFGSMAGGDLTSGSSSSSSKKKSKKKKITIKNYDKDLAALDHQLEMGYISEVKYYKKLQALYKKYKKALKKNTEENREALQAQKQARIDAYEHEVDALDHKLEMGKINEAQYYTELDKLGKKYFVKNGKARKGYLDEYRQWQQDKVDAAVDAYDKEAEALEKQLENGLISLEQYYISINALQKKYLTGKSKTEEREDANDDERDTIIDRIDSDYDKMEQLIEDRKSGLFDTLTDAEKQAAYGDMWQWAEGDEYDNLLAMLDEYYEKGMLSEKDYHDLRVKYLRDYREAKKDAYEEEQDSLNTIIDLVEEMIRQETEDQIDALQKQKDAYSDIIDAKKESLRITEQELKYQEEMDEYATDISELNAQIELLKLDDSRAAQAKRAELEKERDKLIKDQAKAQREETTSRTEDSLDKQDELFAEIIDKAIEKLEAFLNNKSAVLNVVMDTIEQKETNNLLNRLIGFNGEHGDGLRSTVEKAMSGLNGLVEKYGPDIGSIVETLEKGIDVNVTGGIISVEETDYAQTQADIDNQPIGTHHSGLATGFTGDGADIKQHEVYRLLTDDELVFNREDQMRIASQLQVLDTIKNSFDSLNRGVTTQPTQNSQAVELVVNAPITIQGNASAETVDEIKKVISDTANASLDKLNEALRINGLHSRVGSNLRKN